MKTILTIAALLWAHTILAADVSPGLPLGRPLQNGDSITAAVLNGSLNGTINGTFYTSKAVQPNPSSANDIILMWNNSSGIFEYSTFGQFLVNTNLIAARPLYTSGISNTFSLLVLDNAGQLLGQTTISNLLYYGIQLNTNQFALNTNSIGTFTLQTISNAVFTNILVTNFTLQGNVTNGTLAGTVITNSYSTNVFTIGASDGVSSALDFYDSSALSGARAYQFIGGANYLSWSMFNDNFTVGNTFFQAHRQFGNTNVNSVQITCSSNAVSSQVTVYPSGTQIGASGSLVAQVSTFTSGTNNPFAAATLLTFAHGMGARPTSFNAVFVCVTGQNNWSAGDEIPFSCTSGNANVPPANVWADTSNVYVRINNNNANTLFLLDKNSGVQAGMTTNNFKVRVYATYVY